MTDASNPEHNPYSPPPAGEPVVPPAPASVPQDAPQAYQPPPAFQPSAYPPPAAPVPQPAAPASNNNAKVSSIVALVAGAVSIFLLPYVAGILGIGMGANALRANNAAKATGGYVGAFTGMAIAGIVLGALGIVLKLLLDIVLS